VAFWLSSVDTRGLDSTWVLPSVLSSWMKALKSVKSAASVKAPPRAWVAKPLIGFPGATVTGELVGVNAAAVQIVTPNRLRGRTSSLFILTFNIFGLGLGASAVAFCTDFVYHDDALVGASMATTSSILLPLGALLFALARKPMREAVTETIP